MLSRSASRRLPVSWRSKNTQERSPLRGSSGVQPRGRSFKHTDRDVWRRNTRRDAEEKDFLRCLWTADCLRCCCSARLLLRFDFYSLLDAHIVFQPVQSRPSLRRLLTLSPHPSLSVFSSLYRSILSFLLSVCLVFWAHPALQRKKCEKVTLTTGFSYLKKKSKT